MSEQAKHLEAIWIERERKQRRQIDPADPTATIGTAASEATKECRLDLQHEFRLVSSCDHENQGNYLLDSPAKSGEDSSRDRAENERATFPSKGWGEVVPVPAELVGSTILFVGSVPDVAELLIDYRTRDGATKRIVLGFTERGMWIESGVHRQIPIRDDV